MEKYTYGRGKIRGCCYGCEKRHSECPSTCKDYLNEVSERMAKRAKLDEARRADLMLDGIEVTRARRKRG